ncbi:MAG: regulatory protein GemA [Jannaschia sp.]
MSALRRIMAMRREVVCLYDDEDWRDVLERTTGQRSAKGLSVVQSHAVIAELQRLGAKGVSKGPSKDGKTRLSGQYAPKLQALWLSCWNLGLIDDKSDAALNTFAKRQTGLGHGNWIRDPDHAKAVIEALKAMLARGGVKWGNLHPIPGAEWIERPAARVAMAQFRALAGCEAVAGRSFQSWIREATGRAAADLERGEWLSIVTRLGQLVRANRTETST